MTQQAVAANVVCMGSRIAELQLRILWEEILRRFKRIELQAEPERTFSSFINGYIYMPVRVTRIQRLTSPQSRRTRLTT